MYCIIFGTSENVSIQNSAAPGYVLIMYIVQGARDVDHKFSK